jgi:hypothetical protein
MWRAGRLHRRGQQHDKERDLDRHDGRNDYAEYNVKRRIDGNDSAERD